MTVRKNASFDSSDGSPSLTVGVVVTLATAAVLWFVFAQVGETGSETALVRRPAEAPINRSSGVPRHERGSRRDVPSSERVVVRQLSPSTKDYSSHLPQTDEARRRVFIAAFRRAQKQNMSAEAEEVQEYRDVILHDRDPEERADAILMLSGNEHPRAMRTFIQAMDDPNANVRLAAVEALEDYADKLRPQVFAAAIRDQNADVRFEAVDIVGDMKGLRATRLLRAATRDPDRHVRQLAATSLAYRRRGH